MLPKQEPLLGVAQFKKSNFLDNHSRQTCEIIHLIKIYM